METKYEYKIVFDANGYFHPLRRIQCSSFIMKILYVLDGTDINWKQVYDASESGYKNIEDAIKIMNEWIKKDNSRVILGEVPYYG